MAKAQIEALETVGELSENGKYLRLSFHLMLKRILEKYKGKELIITIAPAQYKRSDSQNRFMWAVVVKYARHWLYETQGEKFTAEQVYTWLRLEVLGEKPTITEIAGREVITMTGKRFSAMSVAEFSEATEIIIQRLAERGCIIPEAKKKGNNFIHEFVDDE